MFRSRSQDSALFSLKKLSDVETSRAARTLRETLLKMPETRRRM